MYKLLTGPLLWLTFIIFIGGMLVRLVFLFYLSLKKDQVIYNHTSISWGIKSIVHWVIPWASASMRNQPFFLNAHNIMWDEAFGFSLWSIPDLAADVMTLILIASAVFLVIRRIRRAEVRILTSSWDYILLFLTTLPFITGLFAYHQWGPYETVLILHILSAQVLLILIPFTKLSHMILFFFTRAFIGFEMGGRRGARSW
jgi:hypothetical protein